MSAPSLHNTYWLLRHGRSLANEAGIIISQKENGIKQEYTLAETGRKQATEAGQQLKRHLAAFAAHAEDVKPSVEAAQPELFVYCSPFSRTVETATLAAAEAGILPTDAVHFRMTDLLMERNFGPALEMQSYHGAYESIWAQDALDSSTKAAPGGESVDEVSARVRSLFQELEGRHQGAHILLVSHGDTLCILQATMEGADTRKHTRFYFENAELRRLGTGPVR